MTDENTMNNTNATTAAVPPAPNGHGASNGAANGEPRQISTTETAAKNAQPSSNKKNKKQRHQHDKTSASAHVEPAATAMADPAESTAPIESTATTESAATPEAIETPPSSVEHAAAPSEEESTAATMEAPAESLRLRMKIWTDPTTSKRYLMPSAFMRDVVNGQPVSDVMYAYAMRDDSTKLITLTAAEWNALPFFFFQEDGAAPRATSRPVDGVPVSYAKTP